MGYEKVLEIARQANDTEVIQSLESIQPFDPTNSDHVGMGTSSCPDTWLATSILKDLRIHGELCNE